MSWARVRSLTDFARVLAVAVPPLAVAVWLAVGKEWLPIGLAVALSVLLAAGARAALARRLATVSSVLASFREGDFSIRARITRTDSLLHEVLRELNGLGDSMREQRLGEMEAWALLRKVMAEIDVVVVAFSEDGHVRLANDAAARALRKAQESLIGQPAAALQLDALLRGEAPRVVKDSASLGAGPWELRRGSFRLSGEPHTLVVLSDVSGALREQEREAWKRLIVVMGHEINNSLAPIRSISDNLAGLLARSPRPADWEEDVTSGLEVVGRRAEALGRFMTAYAKVARLPRPTFASMDVAEWVDRVVKLERRLPVAVVRGPAVLLRADRDQLDQLLINLVKNAVEATLERAGGSDPGGVRVTWSATESEVQLVIDDDGPGVAETANLFVPFFTTKPAGTGIGLALARQIAEAHGGEVLLRTRGKGDGGGDGARAGARVLIRLPRRSASSG